MHKARAFFYVTAGLFLLLLIHHLGAQSATAQATANQEVAVLSGQVPNGGTIPLPHYTDGTEALESECSWTVSVHRMGSAPYVPGVGFWRELRCSADGRIVSCTAYSYDGGWSYITGDANYLI